MAALAFHGEPSAADGGAALQVNGAEALEDESQAFVGDLRRVVTASDDAGRIGGVGEGAAIGRATGGTAIGGGGLAHFPRWLGDGGVRRWFLGIKFSDFFFFLFFPNSFSFTNIEV